MLYIAVPAPSTILSKMLNVMNNVGVGIMDTNLILCVSVQRQGVVELNCTNTSNFEIEMRIPMGGLIHISCYFDRATRSQL